MQESYID